VLVAGGIDGNGNSLASAEIYDPATGTFTPTGNMLVPDSDFAAITLANGKVLIVGGSTPQLYAPTTGTFSATGSMVTPRRACVAALLGNGKVLIAGGYYAGRNAPGLVNAELYDLATGTFSVTGNMNVPRISAYPYFNESVLLGNGKVLVVGGITSYDSAEIYDPATGKFSLTGSGPVYSQYGFPIVLLPNGLAFMPGGVDNDIRQFTHKTQFYDPTTDRFYAGPLMIGYHWESTATLLSNGSVLIVGWLEASATVDIYTPPPNNPFAVTMQTNQETLYAQRNGQANAPTQSPQLTTEMHGPTMRTHFHHEWSSRRHAPTTE
jgi:hypothetical protein